MNVILFTFFILIYIAKSQALVLTEWGVFHDLESAKLKSDTMLSIFSDNQSVHGFFYFLNLQLIFSIRTLGCASMNLCSIAEGKADVYFEWGLHSWDIAAGSLIVLEAGGHIYDCHGI